MAKIPIIYAYIHYHLRLKIKSGFLNNQEMRELIGRVATRVGFCPHFLQDEVIKEMAEFNLIMKINKRTYKILTNKKSEKRIKKIIKTKCL